MKAVNPRYGRPDGEPSQVKRREAKPRKTHDQLVDLYTKMLEGTLTRLEQ